MTENITGEEHHALLAAQQKKTAKTIPILIACGLLLIVLSFFGGTRYQKSHQPKSAQNRSGAKAQNGGFGGRRGGFNGQRPTFGAVTAVSSTSITIKDQNDTSTTLAITANTVVTNNRQAGSIGDIQVGDTVAVIAGGSNASRILLNPRFGGGGADSSPTATPAQ
ncbi:MAG: hypothetical protein WA843_03155 [Candidatus Saccharimonadales bacterium]